MFLEGLAIFVCSKLYGGFKTATVGVDLEFSRGEEYYFVSIKSGSNWGNSDQIKKMKQNFIAATKNYHRLNPDSVFKVICINGCCYGRDNKPEKKGYLKLCGQRFWNFITYNENFYLEIIEPIGFKAKEHNENFLKEYSRTLNNFTQHFIAEYCVDGVIDWEKIVKINSAIDAPKKPRKPNEKTLRRNHTSPNRSIQ